MRFGILIGMVGRAAGGLESYEYGLVNSLAALDHDNEYDMFCLNRRALDAFPTARPNFRYHALWPENRWISFPLTLPLALLSKRVETLHATFVKPPICPVPTVFTVHDLGMFTNPEFYHAALRLRMNWLIRAGIRHSRMVICVSNTIRNLVREEFGVPEERLTTVYHGISPRYRPLPPEEARPVIEKYKLRRPYLLFVGQLREGIKNLSRLVQAFFQFREAGHPEVELVLAGRRPYQARYPAAGLDATIKELGIGAHVRELGYVPDEDLPALYGQAEMLVFPSLCEGFGFPVLEAMACGTPVVASSIDTLQEISAGAAVLVNPESADDIAAGIHRVAADANLRDELRQKGLARASEFSWLRAARETLACYSRSTELGDRRERAGAVATT